MNLTELDAALRTLRLSGMADVLTARLQHAQAERLPPLDFIAMLVSDELQRRQDRLLERRRAQARFRDPARSLDTFDFGFNKKMNRALLFELATGRFITQREDILLVGPPGTGKSHVAQALGQAAIQQGYRVLYREAHVLLEELTDATLDGTRKTAIAALSTVPLLIIDDLGMRKLPATAAEDLLEVIMRRYERASTILTSNRPVDDWVKLLGDTAAVTGTTRPAAPSRPRPHLRPAQLADQTPAGDRTRSRHSSITSRSVPAWWPVLRCRCVAGFEVSTEGCTRPHTVAPDQQIPLTRSFDNVRWNHESCRGRAVAASQPGRQAVVQNRRVKPADLRPAAVTGTAYGDAVRVAVQREPRSAADSWLRPTAGVQRRYQHGAGRRISRPRESRLILPASLLYGATEFSAPEPPQV